MVDWLASATRRDPERPCLVTSDTTVTFGALDERVRCAAGALYAAGMERGERVALWGANDLDTVTALWAVLRAGGVVVPLGSRLTGVEAARLCEEAEVRLVVGPEEGTTLGRPALARRRLVEGPEADGVDRDPGEVVAIVHTSGTTGRPKGCLLTAANLEASAAGSAEVLGNGPDDRWLAALPLHHVGGLAILVRSARQAGTVVLEPRFDAERAARLLMSGEVTLASLVSVMVDRMLDAEPGPYPSTVRAVLVGGGPLARRLLERAAEAALPVLPTYGMTETASQIATLPLDEASRPQRRARPIPGAEVRVTADDGREALPGEVGAIEVRGPMVFAGYLGEPPRPPDAWFRTGDRGYLDRDGYLRLVGRRSDRIVSGGENVDPVEVARAIETHPLVHAAAVVGIPDEVWGERVAAVVEVDTDSVDSDVAALRADLERHARRTLASFKVPRLWAVVGALPRTELGKVDRAALVTLLAADDGDRVGEERP